MEDISRLVAAGREELAASDSLAALDDVRVRYLGKKGELTRRLKELGSLSAEERPAAGQAINSAKKELQGAIDLRKKELRAIEVASEFFFEDSIKVAHDSRPSPLS